MTQQKITGIELLQFIRLLGELSAIGLNPEQISFLQSSAGLNPQQVESILEQADNAYEIIKDLFGEGYMLLPPQVVASPTDLRAACLTNDGILQAIVFPTPESLGLSEYTEERNDLFEDLLVGGQCGTGEREGMNYTCLLSDIPFFMHVDIQADTCDRYREDSERVE
ncbi:MAG: hypothetical protein MUC48_27695 [Leptolyngbya sp. Prado105]|nr:hypothetical protein [Leptolyngbya sp. Prado105]